ncbi:MAG TPA: pseudouridine-5'-phosphate glycosidase [Pyrinomonadaceae bacterium]|nr:pseudouridine-5'-phosphate glycosidase [Pyrinomonadaceae bacterium]
MLNDKVFTCGPEVDNAFAAMQPIIALESTVIAHGLPRPQNLNTAQRLEALVKDNGGVPATIAVLNGRLSVGLTQDQIRFIADAGDIKKISIRDLPVAVAQKWNGATTVASTSWIAARAGIKVFATGGIGGVHRGSLPDISADLPVLASTPIIVVCSGAKIVLDLSATREWLETNGVTVVGYESDEMASFYSRESGLPVDTRCDSPAAVAGIFRAQQALGLNRALLVTVPVPHEFEVPAALLKSSLNAALDQAERQLITGRELTPFLLSHMAQASDGATLRANIALLENNARVATLIAVALGE